MLRTMAETAKNNQNWYTIKWPQLNLPYDDLKKSYELLQVVYKRFSSRKYRKSLTPERKEYLTWKSIVIDNFKQKASWEDSFKAQYSNDSLDVLNGKLKAKWAKICPEKTKIVQSFNCMKFHRKKLKKEVPRSVVITEENLYLLTQSFALKEKIPITNIASVKCSTKKDGIIVFHINDNKGDLIICANEKCIEVISLLMLLFNNKGKSIEVEIKDSVQFNNGKKFTPLEFVDSKTQKLTISPTKKAITINIPN